MTKLTWQQSLVVRFGPALTFKEALRESESYRKGVLFSSVVFMLLFTISVPGIILLASVDWWAYPIMVKIIVGSITLGTAFMVFGAIRGLVLAIKIGREK